MLLHTQTKHMLIICWFDAIIVQTLFVVKINIVFVKLRMRFYTSLDLVSSAHKELFTGCSEYLDKPSRQCMYLLCLSCHTWLASWPQIGLQHAKQIPLFRIKTFACVYPCITVGLWSVEISLAPFPDANHHHMAALSNQSSRSFMCPHNSWLSFSDHKLCS